MYDVKSSGPFVSGRDLWFPYSEAVWSLRDLMPTGWDRSPQPMKMRCRN